MSQADKSPANDRRERLRAQLRQLILMRETGPKRAGWHAARARLIWRLHDEIRREEARLEPGSGETVQVSEGESGR
jgi:hypothetical protein